MRNLTRITSGPFVRIRIRSDHCRRDNFLHISQMSTKRKTTNKQSNINFSPGPLKTVKTSKVVRTLPPLPPGVGMACTRSGYVRYIEELNVRLRNARHNGKRINVKFLEYSDSINRGIVVNTSAQLLNGRPPLEFKNNGSNIPRLNAPTGSIHFFLISITKRTNPNRGHAVNVLMDTSGPQPRIWVFDPHGNRAMERNGYGSIFRNRVLPNMKRFFGDVFNGINAKYYNGPNLQANNTRGVCTTFHLDFADAILGLLNESVNIRIFAGGNLNIAGRSAFLNNPTLIGTVTNKRVTKKNTKIPPKLTMTMGATTTKKKRGTRK